MKNDDKAGQGGGAAGQDKLPFINVWSEDFETEDGACVHLDCFDLEEAERIHQKRQERASRQTKP